MAKNKAAFDTIHLRGDFFVFRGYNDFLVVTIGDKYKFILNLNIDNRS